MKTVTSRTISDKELHGELELSEIVEIAKSEILRLKTVNSFDKLLLEVEEIPVTNDSSSFDDGYYRMVLKICSKEKAIGFSENHSGWVTCCKFPLSEESASAMHEYADQLCIELANALCHGDKAILSEKDGIIVRSGFPRIPQKRIVEEYTYAEIVYCMDDEFFSASCPIDKKDSMCAALTDLGAIIRVVSEKKREKTASSN